MKNKVYSGHALDVTLAGATVSGLPYDIGSGYAGVASNTKAANEANVFKTSGVYSFAKDGSAYVVGELVGYDVNLGQVVKSGDAAKDFDLGRVVEVTGAGLTEIKVMVNDRQGPGPSFS